MPFLGLQEPGRVNFEGLRQPLDGFELYVGRSFSLDALEVLVIDPGNFSEFLLRKTALLTQYLYFIAYEQPY